MHPTVESAVPMHRWIAHAITLRTPCLVPSKAIHASQAAGVLCGLAGTIRTVHGDGYPFEVSQRALESHSGTGAVLHPPEHDRWTEAPWALFAYGDRSAFLAQRTPKGGHKVLPFVWRVSGKALQTLGWPADATLAVRTARTHPRARVVVRWTEHGAHSAQEIPLLGAHGVLTQERTALHSALLDSARTVLDALADTQPLLSNTPHGLTGDGPMCTPFQPINLGDAASVVARAHAVTVCAWALGVRKAHIPMALLDLDRAPVWPKMEICDADGLPMPDAARRILAHLQRPYQGIPSTALVHTALHSSDTVQPAAHLHYGAIDDPQLSAHALLAIVKDLPT